MVGGHGAMQSRHIAVKRLRIHGRVQGVGYRWSLARQAQILGVTGWVRNRSDGSVEAMIAGSQTQLAQVIEWAHEGPSAAQVRRVEIEDGEGEFFAFEQWPTM
jgi:acylphosphatase